MGRISSVLALVVLALAVPVAAQSDCPDVSPRPESGCHLGVARNPCLEYTSAGQTLSSRLSRDHQLSGTASYYSAFFDGRLTANGEVYRNARFSAAHLTLPLGSWIEVRSIATARILRLRVNDRGPYSGGFILDLSPSAARALGVDRAEDRRVEITVLSVPSRRGWDAWERNELCEGSSLVP